MTKKRFTLKYINEQHLSANLYDCGTFVSSVGIGAELIVELLNDLSEENDVLKQQLKTKVIVNKQYEELQRLKQENGQLKSEINMLKTTIGRNEGHIDRLTHKGEWR